MLMTEKEAFEKRCPAPMGTMHDERTQYHCIGSQCMAWRFGPDRYIPADVGATKVVQPSPGHFAIAPADGHTLKQGYCGLAGRLS